MPERNQAALDFLLSRRSVPAKVMTGPVPDREELELILTAAARTPDHGKLEPWRFIVLQDRAFERFMTEIRNAGERQGRPEEQIEKPMPHYVNAKLAVVVVEKVAPEASVPVAEQIYSAGAVCLALTNAALASGWGANWLSGWFSHDPQFCKDALNMEEGERIAGIIHIGTPKVEPSDRPRPDVSAKTTWIAE